MASDDLFGSPVGTRLFDADRNAAVNSGLQALDKVGEIAMQPLQMENLRQEGRLRGAQADKALQEAEAERKMADLAARAVGGAGVKEGNIADQLDNLAQLAVGSGLVTRGADLAGKASQIRQREASAKTAAASQLLTAARTQAEQTKLMAGYFGAAKSPEAWQQANELYEFQTGKPSPYATVPFSPELSEGINAAAITSADRARLLAQSASAEALAAFRKSRLKQHDLARGIAGERLALARRRETRLEKQGGGKAISEPTRATMDQVKRLIGADFPDGVEGRDEAAYSIASEAKRLMRMNPALDPGTAVSQAYTAARSTGDFQTTPGTRVLGVGTKDKTTFSARGRSPATALPLPKNAKDASAYTPGRFYTNAGGVTGLFDGTKMLTGADATRWLSTHNPRDESEEEDDSDEGADD